MCAVYIYYVMYEYIYGHVNIIQIYTVCVHLYIHRTHTSIIQTNFYFVCDLITINRLITLVFIYFSVLVILVCLAFYGFLVFFIFSYFGTSSLIK